MIEFLLNHRDSKGRTPLYLATERGNIHAVNEFLELKYHDLAPDSALYSNANNLLVDVNKATLFGDTPLHCAVRKGNLNLVKKLVEKGADPTLLNIMGQSPLHIAVEDRRRQLVEIMLDNNSNKGALLTELFDLKHRTPKFIAEMSGYNDIYKKLKDAEEGKKDAGEGKKDAGENKNNVEKLEESDSTEGSLKDRFFNYLTCNFFSKNIKNRNQDDSDRAIADDMKDHAYNEYGISEELTADERRDKITEYRGDLITNTTYRTACSAGMIFNTLMGVIAITMAILDAVICTDAESSDKTEMSSNQSEMSSPEGSGESKGCEALMAIHITIFATMLLVSAIRTIASYTKAFGVGSPRCVGAFEALDAGIADACPCCCEQATLECCYTTDFLLCESISLSSLSKYFYNDEDNYHREHPFKKRHYFGGFPYWAFLAIIAAIVMRIVAETLSTTHHPATKATLVAASDAVAAWGTDGSQRIADNVRDRFFREGQSRRMNQGYFRLHNAQQRIEALEVNEYQEDDIVRLEEGRQGLPRSPAATNSR